MVQHHCLSQLIRLWFSCTCYTMTDIFIFLSQASHALLSLAFVKSEQARKQCRPCTQVLLLSLFLLFLFCPISTTKVVALHETLFTGYKYIMHIMNTICLILYMMVWITASVMSCLFIQARKQCFTPPLFIREKLKKFWDMVFQCCAAS